MVHISCTVTPLTLYFVSYPDFLCVVFKINTWRRHNVDNRTFFMTLVPGGHLYFRLDIILVKELLKHTLNTYFSGMKIDPKTVTLHTFFSICPSCPFQNLSIWPKTHPFFPIVHVFAPLNYVLVYVARSLKNNPNYVNFLRGWYPTSNTSAPPPRPLSWSSK